MKYYLRNGEVKVKQSWLSRIFNRKQVKIIKPLNLAFHLNQARVESQFKRNNLP